jgi:glycosyltransferase involved in cell wall biosynthesis
MKKMRVLMFGWEFPPHTTGGLGTACEGLTRALVASEKVSVKFVMPQIETNLKTQKLTLSGANNVNLSKWPKDYRKLLKKINLLEVHSGLLPYANQKEYKQKVDQLQEEVNETHLIKTKHRKKVQITGSYSGDLLQEVANYAIAAKKIAKSSRFDVIHVHDWPVFPAGIAARQSSGKPLIAHVHSTEIDRSGGHINEAIFNIEKKGLQEADHIIAVSNFTRDILINEYNLPAKKITVIHNGVDPLTESENTGTDNYKNEILVTFLGRITLQKGPEYFIEAAQKVLQKNKNVKFIMAGSGHLLDAMVEKATRLKLTKHIQFTGFLEQNEVNDLFEASKIFVMPSISEPFGIVPLEAMQFGVPVIISKQSGVAELISNAIKIDYWNTDAIAKEILKMLSDETYRQKIGQKGKEEVRKYRWTVAAQKTFALYNTALH